MKLPVIIGAGAVAGFGTLAIIFDGMYIVNEGHVGVITRWGQAISQEGPEGIKLKMPIATGVREFDVRERRATEDMAAATANQLPITAAVSVNWRLDPTAVLETYRNYGSPEAFETTILDPRLRQAAKAGLSQYQASDLIRDRTAASETIRQLLSEALEGYPAAVLSLQIENVALPERYMESVLKKEEARENAAREEYALQQQKLQAQQTVQTAEADREAAKAKADGVAYATKTQAVADAEAIRLRAEAEADGIRAVESALSGNPLLVEFERAKRWNGQMPQTVLGDSQVLGTMSIN